MGKVFKNGRLVDPDIEDRKRKEKEREEKIRKLNKKRKKDRGKNKNSLDNLNNDTDTMEDSLEGEKDTDDIFGGNSSFDELEDKPTGLEEDKIDPKEDLEEKKPSLTGRVKSKTKSKVKGILKNKKKLVKLKILTMVGIPAVLLFFLFMFIVAPLMLIVLPGGAFAVIEGDGDEMEGSSSGVQVADGGSEENPVFDAGAIDGQVWPVPFTKNITSSFNPRRKHPIKGIIKPHNGADIAAAGVDGKDVVAFLDGRVKVSMYGQSGSGYGGYGNVVLVEHDGGIATLSAHLKTRTVKSGDKVKAGEVIGTVGNTGGSTGSHLHFEVRKSDGNGGYTPIDPKPYLEKFKTTGSPISVN